MQAYFNFAFDSTRIAGQIRIGLSTHKPFVRIENSLDTYPPPKFKDGDIVRVKSDVPGLGGLIATFNGYGHEHHDRKTGFCMIVATHYYWWINDSILEKQPVGTPTSDETAATQAHHAYYRK